MIQSLKDNPNLITENNVVILQFTADWCGPCRLLSPLISELETQYAGLAVIAKVNVDEEREIASQFGIMSIPTILFFKDGVLVEKQVGLMSKKDLKEKIDKLI